MNGIALSDVEWQPKAFSAFKHSLAEALNPDDVGGKNCKNFGQGLREVDGDRLPIGQITRGEVLELARNMDVNTATVAAAIMAWGGMQMNFRDMLFRSPDKRWLDVSSRYRSGEIDRQTAYAQLRDIRATEGLKGAGPAYFTKLIYFLTPRDQDSAKQGYIMDQWAACSINLLLGYEAVLMDVSHKWKNTKEGPEAISTFTVSDVNTEMHYEAFCAAVDALASMTDCTPEQIDRALIANGGRTPSYWRSYLIKHRSV